ncbi:MAG: alpha/beta hydrolase [Mariniblastus sp.]|nr:alpha/beta hydrolase [Mariniblastus sp.]
MTPAEMKQMFLDRVDLGSSDLNHLSESLSSLYIDLQSDVVKRVTVEPIAGTEYTWVDGETGRSDSVFLFFHGGGYAMGSTANHMQLIASLVVESGVSALGVDYRLCPTYRFPSALDDVEAAYRWLMEQGYQANKIGLTGLSAGAQLVTQLVFRCHQKGLPMPVSAVVMSAILDFDFDRDSFDYNAGRDIVVPARLRNIVRHYLPESGEVDREELYPARQHYRTYPRTLFQAGDHEVLLDDNVVFYELLRSQGHEVSLQVVPGLVHCGQMFCRDFAPGQTAIDEAASFIRKTLG